MKKTFNINLAGYPFIIDEDAYTLLKDYLDTIRYAFESNEDTIELAQDIEARIAEIILSSSDDTQKIVTFEDVSLIIDRIGKPSDFIDITEKEETNINDPETQSFSEDNSTIEDPINPPPYHKHSTHRNHFAGKHLFRDPQNSMLGGVCSGLAAYLNIDPTWVRLFTVLLFFLSGTTVTIVYIILWIIVPEANTPLQRMKMMGKDPTVENIGRSVTEKFYDSESLTDLEGQNRPKRLLSNIFSVFVKCLVILGLIIGIPLFLAFIPILIICIIAFFAQGDALAGTGIFGSSFNLSPPGGGLWPLYLLFASLGAIITVGVPIYLLIRMIFNKKGRNISNSNRRSLVVLWIIGIILTAIFTVKTVRLTKYLQRESKLFEIEKLENLSIENNDIESFKVSKDEIILNKKDGKFIIIDKHGITETEDLNREKGSRITDSTNTETSVEATDSVK